MKKQNSIIFNRMFFSIILSTFLFASCKREAEVYTPQSNEKAIKLAVLKDGFDTTGMKDLGKYMLVEGDILLPKTSLLSITPRQAYQDNNSLVTRTKQKNITIRIDDSVPTDGGRLDWRNEVSQAIAEYNNLSTNLQLSLVTTPTADIAIRVGTEDPTFNLYMGTGTIAAAGLPSNGNPFHSIIINSDYINLPSSSTKKYNLVHEIGHCIGFRHTNWQVRSESPALGIGNSPNTGNNPDPSSVFNGGTALYSWNGFSNWDQDAINTLYPKFRAKITNYPAQPTSGISYTFGIDANIQITSYHWENGGGYVIGSRENSTATIYCGNPATFVIYCTLTNIYGEKIDIYHSPF